MYIVYSYHIHVKYVVYLYNMTNFCLSNQLLNRPTFCENCVQYGRFSNDVLYYNLHWRVKDLDQNGALIVMSTMVSPLAFDLPLGKILDIL